MAEAGPEATSGQRSRSNSRVTQADVARSAKVSGAIVSAVINGRDHGNIRISAPTRERVWEAVRELGYVPNIAARSLAQGRNRLIGIFTFQSTFPRESLDFYYEFLVGIEEAAERAGYNLLMFSAAKNDAGERTIYPNGVNCLRMADGAILLGADESAEEIARLAGEDYPFVFVGHREVPGVELSYTAADYVGGTENVVRALVERGHRRIAFVQSAIQETIPGRRAGFRRARIEFGLSEEQAPVLTLGPEGIAPDADAAIAWITAHGITAAVVEVSAVAPKLRAAARRAGLAVPGDLSLVSIGGNPEQPGMSTIAEMLIPRREMGHEAVNLLLRLLENPSDAPQRSTLACGLREGRTLGAPR